jgi:ABC-type multidrug transport system permease subunit
VSGTGRWFLSILVFVAAFFVSYWLVFVQIIPEDLQWLAPLAALLTAMVGAGVASTALGAASEGVLPTVLTCSTVVGAIGFSGGFFGPMIFAPDANQGPLLGLFITGPLGCAVGAFGGLIIGLWRRSRASAA